MYRLSSSIFNENVARLIGEALKVNFSLDSKTYSFNEFMAHLFTGQVQLGLSDTMLYYYPDNPFEAHHPFKEVSFHFMTRHPVREGLMWESIITPLEPQVWIGVILSLISVSFCFFLFSQFYEMHLKCFLNPRFGMVLHCDFFLLTLASCTEPNTFPWFNEKAKAAKILVASWIISLLFISLAYQSNLRASLLRPKMESTVDTIEDMLERG